MSHSNPVQLYKSMMYLNSITASPSHGAKSGQRVNQYGMVLSKTIEPGWSREAYRIQTDISRYPGEPQYILEALDLIGRVLRDLRIGIPVNHYNHTNFVGMHQDLFDSVIQDRPRLMSQVGWDRLLMVDDPEQRVNLDTQGSVFHFTIDFLDKGTCSQDGILNMLCVINTVTKLLQK